jgi:hypothetical protein
MKTARSNARASVFNPKFKTERCIYINRHVCEAVRNFSPPRCYPRPTSVTMVPNGLDLNAEPPIDWEEIGEWEGPAHELDYDLVWTDEGIGVCL